MFNVAPNLSFLFSVKTSILVSKEKIVQKKDRGADCTIILHDSCKVRQTCARFHKSILGMKEAKRKDQKRVYGLKS